jgi:hypothetical protein
MQGIERWPLVLALGAADAVILVDVNDLPAGALCNLPQFAVLVSGGLIERGNPEIQNRALHRRPPIAMHGAYHKSLVKSPLFAHKAASGNSVDFTVTRNTDFRDGFSTQRKSTIRMPRHPAATKGAAGERGQRRLPSVFKAACKEPRQALSCWCRKRFPRRSTWI